MIIKHVILTIDPEAKYDWDKLNLRDPITHERPDLAAILGENLEPGQYLLELHLHVKPLDHKPLKDAIEPEVIEKTELQE
jgi:hypothetical protein